MTIFKNVSGRRRLFLAEINIAGLQFVRLQLKMSTRERELTVNKIIQIVML